MDKKNIIIMALLVVVIIQTAGLVYLWQQPTQPDEEVTLIAAHTTEIGRNVHPQLTRGTDNDIVAQIFEGLFGYVDDTFEIEPILAADMGTVSADGLNYTIPLRQGVKFHDGTEFNATAVKHHFDLMFDIMQGITYIFHQALLNRTEIVDTYTVRFVLNYANVGFRDMLCHVAGRIPSPTATVLAESDPAKLQEYIFGTGPFKFVSRIVDNEVVLKANQDWWRLQPGESIQIDNLVYVQIPDAATMKLALELGDVHLALGPIAETDYASLMANPDLTTYDVSAASPARWLAFNMNASVHDVFPNKLMRQAFAYAVNYDVIIDTVYGGDAVRLYSFLPPEYPGYVNVSQYVYNATKSLELIAEANFTAPVPVTLYTAGSYTQKEHDMVQVIKEYALAAGFDVTIVTQEIGVYRDQYRNTDVQEFTLWRWRADYPTTDNWNVPFMSSYGYGTGNCEVEEGDMAALYPYIDDLVQEAAGTTNETRYFEILEELQVLWAEWVPNLFLYRPMMFQFGTSALKGVLFGGIQWDVRYYDAYFE